MTRARAAAAFLVLAAAVGGCAPGGSGIQSGARVDIYVSMPLHGPAADDGRDVARGARLALADAHGRVGKLEVRAIFLDDTAGHGDGARWSPAVAAANARRASQDSTSIAYVGDFESGATRFSLPITNEAHLLQVSPASSAVDLVQPFLGAGDQIPEAQPTGERTFGRVIPSDEAQAGAGAAWAKRLRPASIQVFRGVSKYDQVVAASFREEVRSLGLRISRYAPIGYAALESSDRVGALAARPRAIGTDALITPSVPAFMDTRPRHRWLITSAAQDPSQLPPAGQQFVRAFHERFHRPPGRYAAYGYEAMAVVLDSIRRAGDGGDDRDSVVDAFFATSDRQSILGTYSIDDVGNTTLNRLAGYRIVNGRPVFATALRAPG